MSVWAGKRTAGVIFTPFLVWAVAVYCIRFLFCFVLFCFVFRVVAAAAAAVAAVVCLHVLLFVFCFKFIDHNYVRTWWSKMHYFV